MVTIFSFDHVTGENGELVLYQLRFTIGLIFVQSEVKSKPLVTRSHPFSRALRQLRLFTLNFDWFTGLSACVLIGWSDYFSFGFTKTALM